MKLSIATTLFLIAITSCTSKEYQTTPATDELIVNRIEFSKKVARETVDRHDVIQLGGNSILNAHIRRIHKMIRKIEFQSNKKELIDFKKEHDFFNWTSRYDASFFNKKKMHAIEALYIIDQLLFEIRNSELGNDYFKYLSIEFDFKQTGDELTFDYRPIQLLKAYYIGPKDSCLNENFTKKNQKTYWHTPINLSSFKKGDTITGGIAMHKMNHPEYVPFEYIKK